MKSPHRSDSLQQDPLWVSIFELASEKSLLNKLIPNLPCIR